MKENTFRLCFIVSLFCMVSACSGEEETTPALAKDKNVAATNQEGRIKDKPETIVDRFCEFSLGAPVSANLSPTGTKAVPTEDKERIFYSYKACGRKVPISIELMENAVVSLRVIGPGNCLQVGGCVGDTYRVIDALFPGGARLLSLEDGRTFSFLARPGLTFVFSDRGLPDQCFEEPASCEREIADSKVESIFLYVP